MLLHTYASSFHVSASQTLVIFFVVTHHLSVFWFFYPLHLSLPLLMLPVIYFLHLQIVFRSSSPYQHKTQRGEMIRSRTSQQPSCQQMTKCFMSAVAQLYTYETPQMWLVHKKTTLYPHMYKYSVTGEQHFMKYAITASVSVHFIAFVSSLNSDHFRIKCFSWDGPCSDWLL